jgi:hypothetical protein
VDLQVRLRQVDEALGIERRARPPVGVDLEGERRILIHGDAPPRIVDAGRRRKRQARGLSVAVRKLDRARLGVVAGEDERHPARLDRRVAVEDEAAVLDDDHRVGAAAR